MTSHPWDMAAAAMFPNARGVICMVAVVIYSIFVEVYKARLYFRRNLVKQKVSQI